ncbi:Fic family protein [Methanolobus vulcani]|uniref:Fic family protein n=1 Tax=Methanolobus vulcani TaxID=38026 RepID=A0A7Z7AZ20_9EURY|nr:Fic family protein [Methanolobus vulcani]SDF65892.1 Fic family protein [Methanolobus vulcani]
MSERAGKFVLTPNGYRSFIPKELPPEPPIDYDDELRLLLSKADRNLARLDGITSVLPNPDLFIAMYVKKEALLSSQIEGTQASLEGVLEFEADLVPKEDINEIKEVVNYISALDYGINRLKETSMSIELIKEIHKILLEGTRGDGLNSGNFKTCQNYIGTPGASIMEAIFVPPTPEITIPAIEGLERFLLEKDNIPALVKIGLIHAQFETIHPFLDGNGRIGRLLITFDLVWKEILSKPLLYLSFYLKNNRSEYYDLLMKVRTEGAWEDWLKFFLKGVSETSEEAVNTAREIIKLKDDMTKLLYEKSVSSIHAIRLIDLLFESPLISNADVVEKLNITSVTATSLMNKFEEIGILTEITGKKRYKRYLFTDYVDIISRGTNNI